MSKFIVGTACFAFMVGTAYADPDVPKEPPVTATSVVLCTERGPQLVAMVVTFADGKVLRIDVEQAHGFTSPQQIMQYGETAKDKYGYYIKCQGEVST